MPRIRFASVEPWDLDKDFFELFKDPRIMPHMHLPIQSGSDRILKKMSRRCKVDEFLNLIAKARSVIPEFNITTDIIVGFPFETQADFEASLKLVQMAKFGHVHTFAYSKREGTKAATLAEQVDETTKKERSKRMHQLASAIKKETQQKLIGKSYPVLWEGKGKLLANGKRLFYGYTPNFQKVSTQVEAEQQLGNQILNCQINGVAEDQCLQGEIELKERRLIKQIAVETI